MRIPANLFEGGPIIIRRSSDRGERVARILALAIVLTIFSYYGTWVSGIGILLAVVGMKLMHEYGKRDFEFLLGIAIALAGIVTLVWGLF